MLRRGFHSSVTALHRNKHHHYDILQIHRGADKRAIKSQYYRLSKKYHPDLNPNNAEAHKKFLEVNEAYAILGNEASRMQYDRELDYGTRTSVTHSPFTTGPSASWHAKRRARATGSTSAKAQAEKMKQQASSMFNHNEHYTQHYEAEEQRRRTRMHNAAERRRAAGIEDAATPGNTKTETIWSRLWRLGVVLGGIVYVDRKWKEMEFTGERRSLER
ncbi:DnaJ sub C member 4 [Apophysomyces ossiformis]|uniref:DnaJ sub C member 4 n=1 Tax=Apophysomyces ossiformis TaxID=679940 RepID=A0A8H7EMH0_9FUNG|nr:DnaJ sub C member 4 [Apophysomyces ossiformis]